MSTAPTKVFEFVKQFTRRPGGRWKRFGQHSGEEFLAEVLEPLAKAGEHTTIDLTGVFGMSSSFIDGSFGEFAARHGLDAFEKAFTIVATDRPRRVREVAEAVKRATSP